MKLTLLHGALGTSIPVAAALVSWLSNIEQMLRLLALLGSIVVAIFTCISLYKRGSK